MVPLLRASLLALLLSLALWGTADAQYKSACSGGSLNTCASVEMVVDGNQVYLRVKNTSSGATKDAADGYRGAVFYEVSVRNLPAGIVADPGTVAMYGTYYSGGKLPARWSMSASNNLDQGITVRNTSSPTRSNGIASNCIPTSLIPKNTNLWMNPTCGSTNVTDPGMTNGAVRIAFRVNETFALTDETQVIIKAIDEHGMFYEVAVPMGNGMVTPEPMSLILLGSGLFGIGAARRRRRTPPGGAT